MIETREFGTGLRDYLEHHGVRLDARVDRPSNADLFELTAAVAVQPEPSKMMLQTAALTA